MLSTSLNKTFPSLNHEREPNCTLVQPSVLISVHSTKSQISAFSREWRPFCSVPVTLFYLIITVYPATLGNYQKHNNDGINHIAKSATTNYVLHCPVCLKLTKTACDLSGGSRKNEGGWLDWDGVNRPMNIGTRSLNLKCHYEYQEMRGWGWLATLFTPSWILHWISY